MKKHLYLCLLLLLCLTQSAQAQQQPKREFRGVWIATVSNIDWPSQPGLSPVVQQEEFRYILDEHQKNGMNAVVVQVRPTTDALYRSSHELWSHWLTGKQGKAPNPPYDPLAFQIEEAHKRGMEFHAWFNPYRASFDTIAQNISPKHITRTKPEWFVEYGGRLYFKPGLPEVREYIVEVIAEVVQNYDIDAVHFDDYFYPYPTQDPFPDDESFAIYHNNITDKDDWRRYNVDEVIRMLSERIKSTKPYVKFGISPFAIWRNRAEDSRGSDTNGLTNYGQLYADVRGWLEKGWIDYVVPQLYFHIGFEIADYAKLLDWWSKNSFDKHLYIGQGTYRINASDKYKEWNDPLEPGRQLRLNRNTANVHGSVYFSSKSVMNNPNGVQDSLRHAYYRQPALVPSMTWIDAVAPAAPTDLEAERTYQGAYLRWKAAAPASDGESARYYLIYRFPKGADFDFDNPANIIGKVFHTQTSYLDGSPLEPGKYVYVVTALDQVQNESSPSARAKYKAK